VAGGKLRGLLDDAQKLGVGWGQIGGLHKTYGGATDKPPVAGASRRWSGQGLAQATGRKAEGQRRQ